MPVGDAVQERPTFEQEVAKFKGMSTLNGEVVDNASVTAEEQEAVDSRARADASAKGAAQVQEDRRQNGTPPAGEKKPAAKPAAAAPAEETPPASEEVEEGDDTKMISLAEAKKMAANAAKKRIGDLTREKRTLQRQLDGTNARFESIERRLTPGAGPAKDESAGDGAIEQAPDPAKFQYGEVDPAYIEAKVRYQVGLELKAAEKKANDKRQSDAAAADAKARTQRQTAFEAKGAEEFDDFQEVVIDSAKAGEWPLSATVAELAFESEHGPAILYELASDLELAKKVEALSPARQAAWFGQQESARSTPAAGAKPGEEGEQSEKDKKPAPKVKVSQAPPPPAKQAKGGSGKPEPQASTTDFREFERLAMGR